MIIRQAEPRDVTAIEVLFHKLLDYLRQCGQKWFHQNQVVIQNGVAGFIIGSVYAEELVMLVAEDHTGVRGFLIGSIRQFPAFFQHEKLGEINWMWPLATVDCVNIARQLSRAFEIWARSKGATAGSNYCLPGNKAAMKAMLHDGREHVFNYYVKNFTALEGYDGYGES